MDLARGQKAKLSDLSPDGQITVTVEVSGLALDVACFGLDAHDKLADDRYMVFFNQPASPGNEVRMTSTGNVPSFDVNLQALPTTINRLSFTASSDGPAVSGLSASRISVRGATQTATFPFSGSDFRGERAVLLADLYRKDGIWRVGAVGQGFNEGLDALVRHFGGEVAGDTAPPPPTPTPSPAPAPAAASSSAVSLAKRERQVSLEKKMAASSPALLSLAKRAAVSLDKRGLGTHTAKVALVLDISASMSQMYRTGKVQAIAERILALGTRFDDDGEIDIFLFGQSVHEAGGMRIENHSGFVGNLLRSHKLEGGTYYGRAMSAVRRHYCGSDNHRNQPYRMSMPVYVMFVTDGATMDKSDTERHLISSSYEPIFWQFLGIGMSERAPGTKKKGFLSRLAGGEFEFLERLDDLPGRHVDNADFFAVKDPATISDDEIFDLLMNEYPGWLVQARNGGLLP